MVFPMNQSRRSFVVASTAGIAGFGFGTPGLMAAPQAVVASGKGKAKSTILFFLSGGASHIDTWDMKPNAPDEYRGLFKQTETTAPGVKLCEHLPLLAKQAKHLAVIQGVKSTVNTNDHHAGYYYNLTGHVPDQSFLSLGNNRTPMPDDWPFMGSVISAKRPPHPYMPNAITLPEKPSKAPYTRPGQFAAKLGVEYDPLYVLGTIEKPLSFVAPSISLDASMNPKRLLARQEILNKLDGARRQLDQSNKSTTWTKLQEKAMSLLLSAKATKAFDVADEPVSMRERYGNNTNGMSLLLARRMVEAGVPFITVFWLGDDKLNKKCKSGGGWDTHGNNFNCLKEDLLPGFDRGFSALIEDLSQRNLLDSTLLMVTSEMGRKPKVGDPRSGGVNGAGRDHWTHCLSVLMAGGGIQGGQVHGSSDKRGEFPEQKIVTPADVTKTVYHAMGISDLEAHDKEGRPYNLLAEGEPILDLF
ncbi:MAG: DUF1501 domain-containing protein [Planctomycetota bacterium]|nr:MAG: DUF1501 domain-containing protein [Planctomycetota bacterium]